MRPTSMCVAWACAPLHHCHHGYRMCSGRVRPHIRVYVLAWPVMTLHTACVPIRYASLPHVLILVVPAMMDCQQYAASIGGSVFFFLASYQEGSNDTAGRTACSCCGCMLLGITNCSFPSGQEAMLDTTSLLGLWSFFAAL